MQKKEKTEKFTSKNAVSKGNCHIYYSIQKNKGNKWIVFLHGLGGDSTAWNTIRDFLHTRGFSTLAIDLRGHGFSDHPKKGSQYEISVFAKDIVAVIEKEKLNKPILIGHCLGGMVAMEVAAQYPTVLGALVLVDTSIKAPRRIHFLAKDSLANRLLENFARFFPLRRHHHHVDFSKYIGTGDYDIKRITSDVLHTSPKSYAHSFDAMLDYDASPIINNIQVPTLVIEGSKDTIFPLQAAHELVDKIPGAKLEVVEGANHIIVLNNPKELSERILGFLKKIS